MAHKRIDLQLGALRNSLIAPYLSNTANFSENLSFVRMTELIECPDRHAAPPLRASVCMPACAIRMALMKFSIFSKASIMTMGSVNSGLPGPG